MKTRHTRKNPQYLIVVAHPDDETLFFSGVLLKFGPSCHVICITDGNADGLGPERAKQFKQACDSFKVQKYEMWNFPDRFSKRLNTTKMAQRLSALLPKYKKIFTHGILGEYGHPHHQDVSYATHLAFNKKAPVFSVAYNNFPDFRINLSRGQHLKKMKILTEVYYGEIRRFLNYIPATFTEGYAQLHLREIKTIYIDFLKKKPTLKNTKLINSYHGIISLLQRGDYGLKRRPF